jgi:hypothetical protein
LALLGRPWFERGQLYGLSNTGGFSPGERRDG